MTEPNYANDESWSEGQKKIRIRVRSEEGRLRVLRPPSEGQRRQGSEEVGRQRRDGQVGESKGDLREKT